MIFFLVLAISLSIVQSKEQDLSLNSLGPNVNYNTPNDEFGNDPVLLDSIDAGVTEIYLPDTVGYGDRVRPKAKIKNFGSATADIPARMRIGSSYNQVQNITLGPNCEDTLTFPLLAAFTQGWVMASCSTELFGDQNPGNDRLIDSICVLRFDFDIGIETIPLPETLVFFSFDSSEAIIRNFGTISVFDSLIFGFTIYIRDSILPYIELPIFAFLDLMPDDTVRVGIGGFVALLYPGEWLLSYEIWLNDGNPLNNKKFKRVIIRYPAIKELRQNPFSHFSLKSTVMKIDQFKSSILKSEPESEIFDINGRRIKIERVKEGIYFIKTRTGDKKVVIIK